MDLAERPPNSSLARYNYRAFVDDDHKRREEYLEKYSVAQALRAGLLQSGVTFRVSRSHVCTANCDFARDGEVRRSFFSRRQK